VVTLPSGRGSESAIFRNGTRAGVI
jgi:hypothetical protein